MKEKIAVLVLAATGAAFGANLTCAVDDPTGRVMCYRDGSVRRNARIVETRLYQGGTKRAEDSGLDVRVNCATRSLTLTDARGIKSINDAVPSTELGRNYVDALCRAPAKVDPKLKP